MKVFLILASKSGDVIFKYSFFTFSSVGPVVQHSRILLTLEEGLMRNIYGKLYGNWARNLGDV